MWFRLLSIKNLAFLFDFNGTIDSLVLTCAPIGLQANSKFQNNCATV